MATATFISVTDTSPQAWKYVSEGGATIVFTYVGPSHPHFNDMVLRLRKTTISQKTSDTSDQAGKDGGTEDEPDDPSVEFQKKCIERLLPAEHLPRLESIHVDRGWLEALATLHDTERPDGRRQKDHIDLSRTKAVLATDLVGGEWLVVEIKPKWAFLPSSFHLSESTRPVKTRTCRFCMHSYMRARQGEVVSFGYCPLDLFSNNEDRISNAIRALWDAWNNSNGGVNNFKVFKRGRLIQPSNISYMCESTDEPVLDNEGLRDTFTSALLPFLTDTPLLRILSKLQRTLDILDIEGLSCLLRDAETSTFTNLSVDQSSPTRPTCNPSLGPPVASLGASSDLWHSGIPTMSDWTDFLDVYLSSTGAQLNHSEPMPENLRYYLLAYLLSATFKDCSIIIRLDPLSLKRPSKAVAPDRVTVIDLDPKSVHRLRKWEQLDQEIVQAYLDVENPKRCIDGPLELRPRTSTEDF